MPKKRVQKRVSSTDVAKLAGVSQSAVSRTFNPNASISPHMREKVLAAAKELGYRPNVIARSLIQQSTKLIGIVVLNFMNPFVWMLMKEFTERLQDLGYRTLVLNVAHHQEVEEALSIILQYQVDGIIIASATISWTMADECAKRGTPVVLLNRYMLGSQVNAVCCDGVHGGRLAADILLESGCQQLAFVAGTEGSTTSRDRETGFKNRLEERGNHISFRESGDYSYQSACKVARQLLGRDNPPDGIFCCNDSMAIGVIDVARCELGIHIPDELSVIGFDDIPMASWLQYSLTTFRQPIEQMVQTALDLLTESLDNSLSEAVLKIIPGKLIERQSVKKHL